LTKAAGVPQKAPLHLLHTKPPTGNKPSHKPKRTRVQVQAE
jgi:hypothetical protein